MYTAPKSVEEAAKVLDKDKPGWAECVYKPINMGSNWACVLYQVYGEYAQTRYRLFGFQDTKDIFGAHDSEWQLEVDLRQEQAREKLKKKLRG